MLVVKLDTSFAVLSRVAFVPRCNKSSVPSDLGGTLSFWFLTGHMTTYASSGLLNVGVDNCRRQKERKNAMREERMFTSDCQ